MIWAHAADPDQVVSLFQLAKRAQSLRPDVNMLLTLPPLAGWPDSVPDNVIFQPLPEESSAAARGFIEHWKPQACVWQTGHLRSAVLNAARAAEVPMVMVGADVSGFEESRLPWRRRSDRAILNSFRAIYANTANVAKMLIRAGVDPEVIDVTGPLQEGGPALRCNEADRAELSESLAIRPVWLAAMVQPDEFPIVIEAHRQALRAAHRMMLILVPRRPEDGAAMVASLKDQGLRYVVWSEGGFPEETTQIIVADTYGEMGMWYRLSPVTFMGSSLTAGHGGRDPYEPAALGSAIVYGPNVSRFIRSYSKFAKAGAARLVKDASSLSAAVLRLNAPDQSASMAQAAWEVATEGAEVTDKVLQTLEDILDEALVKGRATGDARA